MPELELGPAPPRPELLRLLRARLGGIDPELRVVAQDWLGADAPIDLLAVDGSGRAVLVLLEGPGGELELLGRGLVQCRWAEARLADWIQLAPQLGLRPEAGCRAILVGSGFRPETRAAARALGPLAPELVSYRCVLHPDGLDLLLERPPASPRASASPARAPERSAPPASFRSGLSEAELALSPEERSEFEPV